MYQRDYDARRERERLMGGVREWVDGAWVKPGGDCGAPRKKGGCGCEQEGCGRCSANGGIGALSVEEVGDELILMEHIAALGQPHNLGGVPCAVNSADAISARARNSVYTPCSPPLSLPMNLDPRLLMYAPMPMVGGRRLDELGREGGVEVEEPASSFKAFFTFHMDPTSGGEEPAEGKKIDVPNTNRPAANWQLLEQIVYLANSYGHHLTLQFTPQWAYFAQTSICTPGVGVGSFSTYGDCIAEVRDWIVTYGHELALHHHASDAMAQWDGYTDSPEDLTKNQPLYELGTMDEARDMVADLLPDNYSLYTSNGYNERPSGLIYGPGGGPNDYDLLSYPCATFSDLPNPQFSWRITHRLFYDMSDWETEIDAAMLAAGPQLPLLSDSMRVILGLVAHETDTSFKGMGELEALFAYLNKQGVSLQTVVEILSGSPYRHTAAPGVGSSPALNYPDYTCDQFSEGDAPYWEALEFLGQMAGGVISGHPLG